MLELREYQKELLYRIRLAYYHGKKSICVVLGCGGGKSVIIAELVRNATSKGKRVLFLVHRKELLKQIERTFIIQEVNFNLCTIMMVQTATKRLDKIKTPDVIVTDEAHHSLAKTYTNIYDRFNSAIRLGFTATPIRLNEGGLGRIYDHLEIGVSTKWLIENNYLAPFKYFAASLVNTDELHVSRGDYKADEVAQLMEHNAIYGDTVKTYQKIANGKKTIVYCASIKSSIATANEFCSVGINAVHVDGTTNKDERETVIEKFRKGEVTILCNVDLFGEGLDVPDCECVIMLRPTQSVSLFIQQSMRSMRYKLNKTAYIIDHVCNCFRHGLPDQIREWSLKESKKKTKKKNGVLIKSCPICYFVTSSSDSFCPECGTEFEKKERKELKRIDAEFKEITEDDVGGAGSTGNSDVDHSEYKEFYELDAKRKANKYKFMWTIYTALNAGIRIPSKYSYQIRLAKRNMN